LFQHHETTLHEAQAGLSSGQEITIQHRSSWGVIGPQFDGCAAWMFAVQRGVQNPLAQFKLMTERAAYRQAKITCVGVDEAWRDSSIATVPMNEAEVRFPHFPGLLHNLGQHSAPHYVAWMIPVQIDLH
jgi:hypothetical protein